MLRLDHKGNPAALIEAGHRGVRAGDVSGRGAAGGKAKTNGEWVFLLLDVVSVGCALLMQ